ncbi:single Ig IL-1-related receptor [Melospiza melodia melodia]|uniref:single Ig IL-1-related receptor n=1 Tax=Melospiza melodia melodia TaxID=1914991 RepID=UPI002FD5C750
MDAAPRENAAVISGSASRSCRIPSRRFRWRWSSGREGQPALPRAWRPGIGAAGEPARAGAELGGEIDKLLKQKGEKKKTREKFQALIWPVGSAQAGGDEQEACGWGSSKDLCSVPPEILVPAANETLELVLGSQVELNCTVRWAGTEHCQPIPTWSKDGQWLGRGSSQDTVWSGQNSSEQLLASVLQLNLTQDADFGVFACWISNATATFTLRRAEAVGHVPAVLAALLVLLLLVLLAVLYVQCRLNALLWYRDRYGELEINDGKLYDAYVSHANAPDDRKFIHFIMKPQLENRHGYKLFLDEQNILPNSEPSADLIMNVSRCRRLIVVLSVAYLEQEWCNSSFREGLWRLLELSRKPIFIVFESQYREITHPAITLLKQHRSAVTLLVWRAGSMTPSSDFWKELCLALPRKVSFPAGRSVGDPQTQLQEDKDPMLILHSSYLDSAGDLDPEGDLGTGLRGRIFGSPPPPRLGGPSIPRAPASSGMEEAQLRDGQRSEIDVSDLGSRNYGARTDFYCLVTEDDI